MQYLFLIIKSFLTFLKISFYISKMQFLVRFGVLYRIKPHVPLLELTSVNSFEFQPCGRSSQAEYLRVSLNTKFLFNT